MIDALDPVPQWTRTLMRLRGRAAKLTLRRSPSESDTGEIIDEALNACDGLLRDLAGAQLKCERLRGESRVRVVAWEHLFDSMPIACVLSDNYGLILSANPSAGLLLNVTPKRLIDRQLLMFTEDRDGLRGLLRRLTGEPLQHRAPLTLRPRERKRVAVDVTLAPASPMDSNAWLWFFAPSQAPRALHLEDALSATLPEALQPSHIGMQAGEAAQGRN